MDSPPLPNASRRRHRMPATRSSSRLQRRNVRFYMFLVVILIGQWGCVGVGTYQVPRALPAGGVAFELRPQISAELDPPLMNAFPQLDLALRHGLGDGTEWGV